VYRPAIPEAHLGFGRMHIHIHRPRVDFQEQAIARMAAVVQHVLVSLPQGVGEEFVPHETAIDEDKLGVPAGAGPGGLGGVAGEGDAAALGVHPTGFGEKVVPQNGPHPGRQIAPGQAQAGPTVVAEAESHVRVG